MVKHSKTKWTKKVDKSFGTVDNVHYICKIKIKTKNDELSRKRIKKEKSFGYA
jgi:hypothetical protein